MAIPNENQEDATATGERIAKVIARSGLCSRREAEGLIEEGRVSVNGALIDSAALDILPSDKVLVDGSPLAAREPPRLWRYCKPKGRVSTHKDPEGRPTVFEALPEHLPRLISVGRLDFNTEGLLLLTNDGDLARHLELPSTGWSRRYRVRAYGQVSDAQLEALADGITIDGMKFGPVEASLEREQGDNVWITLSIREGKNREVRRIMEHLGLTVNRLIRISFGPFILGELEPGQIEEVKTAVLKDQLGPRLTRQLGVRREPMREERRIGPARGKPTYLRRKPGPEVRPERARPEAGPLKRRRVFAEGSGEAPTVEFVAERSREGRDGEHSGKAPFRSRGGEREGGQERRFERRSEDAGERKERPPFRKREDEPGGERKPRFEKRGENTGVRAERPPFRKREEGNGAGRGERPPFRSRDGAPDGERKPQFRPRGDDAGGRAERPPFRSRDGAPDGERKPQFRPRSGDASGSEERRPFRSRDGAPDGERKPQFRPRGGDAGGRGRDHRSAAARARRTENASRRSARAATIPAGAKRGGHSAAATARRMGSASRSGRVATMPAGAARGRRSAAARVRRMANASRSSVRVATIPAGAARDHRSAAARVRRMASANRRSGRASTMPAGAKRGGHSAAATARPMANTNRVSRSAPGTGAQARENHHSAPAMQGKRGNARSASIKALAVRGSKVPVRKAASAVRQEQDRNAAPGSRARVDLPGIARKARAAAQPGNSGLERGAMHRARRAVSRLREKVPGKAASGARIGLTNRTGRTGRSPSHRARAASARQAVAQAAGRTVRAGKANHRSRVRAKASQGAATAAGLASLDQAGRRARVRDEDRRRALPGPRACRTGRLAYAADL